MASIITNKAQLSRDFLIRFYPNKAKRSGSSAFLCGYDRLVSFIGADAVEKYLKKVYENGKDRYEFTSRHDEWRIVFVAR